MLMINNHFARFRLPGYLLKTKKNVLPIFVATRNFLFIGNYISVQAQKLLLKLKFDILRVPPIQIPTKKGQNLNFYWENLTVKQI
jgi:hypothetical protein